MALAENPIMFTNNPLDRAGHNRTDAAWVAAQLPSNTALIVPLWQFRAIGSVEGLWSFRHGP